MFSAGTKVVVIASSISSEKTGPRVGSSGFVYGNNLKCAFQNNDLCPKYSRVLSTLFSPQRIIFTNFGFELKHRMEEKLVMCILPMSLHNRGFNTYLTYMLTDIIQNGLHNKKWQDAMEAMYNYHRRPICLVIPDTCPKPIKSTDIILFKAWLKAMLKSKQISNCLYDLSPKLLKKIDLKIVDTLVGMSISQRRFNNVEDKFLEQYQKDIMYTIALLNTINNSQQRAIIQTRQISDILVRSELKRRTIEILSNITFSPIFNKLYDNTKKVTIENEVAKNRIIPLMNNMLTVKNKLINLYPTLIQK